MNTNNLIQVKVLLKEPSGGDSKTYSESSGYFFKSYDDKKSFVITSKHSIWALLHKDLKCKAPLIEPNLRRNLGKWST